MGEARLTPLQNNNQICENIQCECPALPLKGCSWKGRIKDLVLHFKTDHKRYYRNINWCKFYYTTWMEIAVRLNQETQETYLFDYPKDTFLLQLISDLKNQKLWCGIRYIGEAPLSRNIRYRVVTAYKTSVFRGWGKMEMGDTWDFNIESVIEINLRLLRTEGDIGSLMFNICGTPCRNPFFIGDLKCSLCLNQVEAPVTKCQEHHIICNECRNKDNHCGYIGKRSCPLTLRDITKMVEFPCKNENIGCTFASNRLTLGKHERYCFAMSSCFTEERCEFTGVARFWWYHLQAKHPEIINEHKNLLIYDLKEALTEKICYMKSGVIFKICCLHKRTEGSFIWTLQQVGLRAGEDPRINYVGVHIVDPMDSEVKLRDKIVCSSLTEPNDEASNKLIVRYEILEPFISDQKLYFHYKWPENWAD